MNKYEGDYRSKEPNSSSNSSTAKLLLIGGIAVIVIIVGAIWISSMGTDTPTNNIVNTSNTTDTVKMSTTTATSTPGPTVKTSTTSAVKAFTPTQIDIAWTAFKKNMACELVDLPRDTTVLSFRGEGESVKDNGAAAYKCKDGHTYIY